MHGLLAWREARRGAEREARRGAGTAAPRTEQATPKEVDINATRMT